MKKNLLHSAMALFAVLFAACGQEEIVSDNGQSVKGDIRISVQAPVAPATRAGVTVPEGYTMQCIMQLLDKDNATVGEQQTQSVDASTGTASFTIAAASLDEATQALFWAEYVPASGEKVYDTADLKAIGYKTTEFDMSNAALMAACDAFCGKQTALADGASVTLTRPFAKVSVTPSNPDAVSGTGITVSYTAPSGFSVLDGTTSGAGTNVTYTDSSFAPAANEAWFSNFIFAPETATNFEQPITMTVGNTAITIPAGKLPLDANMEVDATFTIEGTEAKDITVNVQINPEYEKLELAVGSYINAKGEVVANAENAVAIVYALAGKTDNSDYGEGKKAKAYAIALAPVTGRAAINDITAYGLETTADDYSGYTYDAALKEKLGDVTNDDSKLFYAYYSATLPTLTGENLSTWYIPSKLQLADAMNVLNVNVPKALSEIYDKDYYVISSSIDAETNASKIIYGVLYKMSTTTVGSPATLDQNASAFAFPALTIFE